MFKKFALAFALTLVSSSAAFAASFDFTLASDEVVDLSAPLVEGAPTAVWTSATVSQGTSYASVRVFVNYTTLVPDTDLVSPFSFELLAVLEQQQQDSSWEEIGRQNMAIRKLEQGAVREIIVSPSVNSEEGVDQVIAGFAGVPVKLKSMFKDDAQGALRVILYVLDGDPSGPNPFDGVTFSVNGQRYDG